MSPTPSGGGSTYSGGGGVCVAALASVGLTSQRFHAQIIATAVGVPPPLRVEFI